MATVRQIVDREDIDLPEHCTVGYKLEDLMVWAENHDIDLERIRDMEYDRALEIQYRLQRDDWRKMVEEEEARRKVRTVRYLTALEDPDLPEKCTVEYELECLMVWAVKHGIDPERIRDMEYSHAIKLQQRINRD